jgi:epoxyqueuosine reductase
MVWCCSRPRMLLEDTQGMESSSKAEAALKDEVRKIVRDRHPDGESLVGFSNLYGIVDSDFSDLIYGITVAIKLDDAIVDEIVEGPTKQYVEHYHEVNRKLDEITRAIADLIRSKGAKAEAIPATLYDEPTDPQDPYYRNLSTSFPHKTAATRAGLGWIGKTALFVSDRYGPRVRLGTVLTDHPLETGIPCEMSLCGDCRCCVEACPVNAADGMEWFPGLERDEFFDASKCRANCLELAEFATGEKGVAVCGICMAACPVGIEFRTQEDEWI